MANTTMSASFAESDFRVGRVLGRTATILSQHFVIFFLVAVVAATPTVLLVQRNLEAIGATGTPTPDLLIMIGVGFVLAGVLGLISQAVMLHAAFQAMRHRPVSLGESLRVGLARVLSILGLAIVMGVLLVLGFIALVIPMFILLTMWWVATPACVVERTGPWSSLKRSAALTKGHRWKVFGLMVLLSIINIVVSQILEVALVLVGSDILSILVRLFWVGLIGAYNAIAVVMAYHDLRVAKEGIDIEQIASVFD
jgi:hypothetical protein